jgi:hypothetical protein
MERVRAKARPVTADDAKTLVTILIPHLWPPLAFAITLSDGGKRL